MSPSVTLRLLNDSLFASLDSSVLARLVGAAEEVVFQAGAKIFAHGEAAEAIYLIEAGKVCLVLPSGRKLALYEQRCGEESICGLPHYTCTAQTLSEVKAYRLPTVSIPALKNLPASFKSSAMLALGSALAEDALAPTISSHVNSNRSLSSTEIWGWLACLLVPVFVYNIADQNLLAEQVAIFLALLSAAMMMWIFRLVDEFIPPVVVVVSTLFIGLVPREIALSGFSSNSLFTFLGVFALSETINSSGLSYRFVLWLLRKLPNRSVFHEGALLVAGYVLSPISPSANNRLALVLTLFRDMRESLGLEKKSPGATALMTACFSGSMLMAAMFATSRSASISAVEMLPAQIRDRFSGVYWFVAAAFVAVATTIIHFVLNRFVFSKRVNVGISKQRVAQQLNLLGPLSYIEKVAIVCFVIFTIGSSTVSLHHISPAWLAGIVLVILLISDGLSKNGFRQKLDWPIIFFLVGIDCLTRMMKYLGIDDLLTQHIATNFDFIQQKIEIFILVSLVVTCVVRLVLPVTAGMLVACIMLLPLAQSHGIHPWIALFLAAIFSDIWFFKFQCSPYMQIESSGMQDEFHQGSFRLYNRLIDVWRVIVVFLSIPYWRWLGLL